MMRLQSPRQVSERNPKAKGIALARCRELRTAAYVTSAFAIWKERWAGSNFVAVGRANSSPAADVGHWLAALSAFFNEIRPREESLNVEDNALCPSGPGGAGLDDRRLWQ
jgi:hypothetical protein